MAGPAVLRDVRVPLWEQLRRALLSEIRDRALAPGTALESEAELCERFKVSRTVVRQALGELERQGHVTRAQGRGTFVSQPKLREHFLDRAGGLFTDLASRGHAVHSTVLACEAVEGDVTATMALGLAPTTQLVRVDRLREVDGEALVFTRSWLPAWLGGDLRSELLAADLEVRSLYGFLEERYGIRIVTAERTIEAVTAERWVARHLGVRPGSALLRLKSVARDPDDRPVEYFEAWHRGDRALFELRVRGDAAVDADPLPSSGGLAVAPGSSSR
jgi:GntR family transcriptional regulator